VTLREAKESRPRLARLGSRRHGSDLEKSEPEPSQPFERFRILVEARRKTHGIRKRQPHQLDGCAAWPRRWPAAQNPERIQRKPVSALGIE
jgi:hypothetical protein